MLGNLRGIRTFIVSLRSFKLHALDITLGLEDFIVEPVVVLYD